MKMYNLEIYVYIYIYIYATILAGVIVQNNFDIKWFILNKYEE